jgi:hypothetical protein
MSHYREVKTIQHEPGQKQRLYTYKATQLIYLAFIILESLILLRIVLKALGANPQSMFSAFLYGFTDLFLFPFFNLVPTPTFGNMVFEIFSVIAMAVYALVGWAVESIVYLVFYRPKSPVITEHSEISENFPPTPPQEVRRTTVIDHIPRDELTERTVPKIHRGE